MILLGFFIIYIIIGVVIVEIGKYSSESYNEFLKEDGLNYVYQVMTWLPDTIEFLINGEDDDDDFQNYAL